MSHQKTLSEYDYYRQGYQAGYALCKTGDSREECPLNYDFPNAGPVRSGLYARALKMGFQAGRRAFQRERSKKKEERQQKENAKTKEHSLPRDNDFYVR